MKPIYKSLALAAMTLQVSLALNAQTYDGTTTSETALPAELLDNLRVELIAPNVSGARDLIKSGECVIDGSNLAITLNAANWIKGATYRVQVVATFGTQTQVIYALDVTVPYYEALSNTPQEYEDDVTVVSTIGDGDKSGADASVYAKDGDGNAHITTPLSVGDGVAGVTQLYGYSIAAGTAYMGAVVETKGTGAYAGGYANGEYSKISASNEGAVALGHVEESNGSIEAQSPGAIARGFLIGGNAQIHAVATASHAAGYADENSEILAGGSCSTAIGFTTGGGQISSDGNASLALGEANLAEEGQTSKIQASGRGSVAIGVSEGCECSIHASGDGAIAVGKADDTLSLNAFGDGSQAFGIGTTASGEASHAEGSNTIAEGDNSHVEGEGTIAAQDNQHVCGRYNVEDTDGDYAFIIGNGTADDARSNAFAIDWNGNLVLFDAGTPVILTPAKLAALIA